MSCAGKTRSRPAGPDTYAGALCNRTQSQELATAPTQSGACTTLRNAIQWGRREGEMPGDLNCRLCDNRAAVRVHGAAMCSSCAVMSTGGVAVRPPRKRWLRRLPRAAVLALITAAVAVFGATATAMTVSRAPIQSVNTTTVTPTSAVEPADGGAALPWSDQLTEQPAGSDDLPVNVAPESGQDLVAFAAAASDRAHELAEAMQSWAGCVSRSASAHSRSAVDLTERCGSQPRPSDYDLTPLSTPPGQTKKDDPNTTPPGQTKKDDPNTTPPGQTKKDDPNTTPPGQAKNEKKDK